MKDYIRLDFQLLGTTIPPKEISEVTGITPDVAFMRGERNAKLNLPRQNIWAIASRVNSHEVGDHWKVLEEILGKSKEKLREIAKTGTAKITLVINGGQRIPSISIPPSMSEFAGYVNAAIDIDHIQQ